MTTRYCLALDLKPDKTLIKEYETWHQKIWPEIIQSIKSSGIEKMEIYRVENRLFMIMEVNETFSFETKSTLDEENAKVVEWEKLMWQYQQAIPGTKQGQKWRLMERIFSV